MIVMQNEPEKGRHVFFSIFIDIHKIVSGSTFRTIALMVHLPAGRIDVAASFAIRSERIGLHPSARRRVQKSLK